MNLPQLRRIRWAVRATLALGVAASVAANILHAQRNPVSEVIAAWPPLALLLTVELISRLPVHRRSLAAVRLLSTAAIAGIAAYVSYWHMVGVAAHYGETGPSPYLLPFSVDGLVVVASVSLVELAGRIREAGAPNGAPEAATAAVSAVADTTAAEVETMVPLEVSAMPDTTSAAAPPVRLPVRRQTAADRVVKAATRTPAATPAQLAARLKLSERTVQRYLPRPAGDTTPPPQRPSELVNGHSVPALVTAD